MYVVLGLQYRSEIRQQGCMLFKVYNNWVRWIYKDVCCFRFTIPEWDESTRMYVVLGLQYLSDVNRQGCMLF